MANKEFKKQLNTAYPRNYPQANAKGLKIKGVKIQTVGTIKEAVAIIKAMMKDTVN